MTEWTSKLLYLLALLETIQNPENDKPSTALMLLSTSLDPVSCRN